MLADTASALAWRLKRPDVALYNTIGELKYDLAYPDSVKQRVDLDKVQQWMRETRQSASVGVVMRVKGDGKLPKSNDCPRMANIMNKATW